MKLLLSPEEAAETLSLKRTFLFSLLRDGRLESIKLGKRRLIPRDSLDRFIERERAEQAAANGDA